MPNKNNDEFSEFSFKIRATDKSVQHGKPTGDQLDLLIRAKNVVIRHTHRKYRHDRTTEDGSMLLPISVIEDALLDRRNFGRSEWDLNQIENEVAACKEEGLVKMRVPAALIVYLLEPKGCRLVFHVNKPIAWETIESVTLSDQDAHVEGTVVKGPSMGALVAEDKCVICGESTKLCKHVGDSSGGAQDLGIHTLTWDDTYKDGKAVWRAEAKLRALGVPAEFRGKFVPGYSELVGYYHTVPPKNPEDAPIFMTPCTGIENGCPICLENKRLQEAADTEETLPGSIGRLAQREVHSCPHKITREDWEEEVRILAKDWLPKRLSGYTEKTFGEVVLERLLALIDAGLVNGPIGRFDIYSYTQKGDFFITVLDTKRTEWYHILGKEKETKFIPFMLTGKWVLWKPDGKFHYNSSPTKVVFGETDKAFVTSETDPFGTVKVRL